jgi:hypothetical protein
VIFLPYLSIPELLKLLVLPVNFVFLNFSLGQSAKRGRTRQRQPPVCQPLALRISSHLGSGVIPNKIPSLW